MLISRNWIKDFVDLPEMDAQKLAEKITLAVAEVEGVEEKGLYFKKIRVCEITAIRPHPEASKLNLVSFTTGDFNDEVVCGAPNLEVGQKVPYAPLGTTLPGDFLLTAKKIRGIESRGMLCSKKELNLGEDHDGLMQLPKDAPIGMTLGEFLKKNTDTLLDIDNKSLTHRPDLWGHYGLAREFAGVFNLPLKRPWDQTWQKSWEEKFTKEESLKPQMDKESCGTCFVGTNVTGVKVKKSPSWMIDRLENVGLRSINSIVDISNYVMLEMGTPNHIYDADQIEGRLLKISLLQEDCKFQTLDEIERKLVSGDTVISDEKGPLIIAGIMGGLRSSVTESTQNLFIEAANWDPKSIRSVSTRLGLRTDSSMRFEKSLDSSQCRKAVIRIVELIREIHPESKISGPIYCEGDEKVSQVKIETSADELNKLLGTELEDKKMIHILESLDFECNIENNKLIVLAPTHRSTGDIETSSCISEEIGRMIGYDNIVPKAPKGEILPSRLSNFHEVERKVENYLVYRGEYYQGMTYPLVGAELYKSAHWSLQNPYKLANPLGIESAFMRTSLVPQLLNLMKLNQKNFNHFRMFEWGRVYAQGGKERTHLGLMQLNEKGSFKEVVDTIESLLTSLHVPFEWCADQEKFPNNLIPYDWDGRHPLEFLNLKIMGKIQGGVCSLHPLLAKDLKIKGKGAIGIIDFEDIAGKNFRAKKSYSPLAKFPGSEFDCTFMVEAKTPVENLLKALKKVKLKEMVRAKIFDVYAPNKNEKSVTLRITFQDKEKTLSGEFLTSAKDKVVAVLESAGYPLKRE